jgi:hypothetical protein
MKSAHRKGLLVAAGITCMSLLTWSAHSLFVNKQTAWKALKLNKEAGEIITGHLQIGDFLSLQQALDSGTYREISDRYRVYRFISPQTCGTWGCLNVIFDSHLQKSKAYHLKTSNSLQDTSNLLIDKTGCVSFKQTNTDGIIERYPLCLNPNS